MIKLRNPSKSKIHGLACLRCIVQVWCSYTPRLSRPRFPTRPRLMIADKHHVTRRNKTKKYGSSLNCFKFILSLNSFQGILKSRNFKIKDFSRLHGPHTTNLRRHQKNHLINVCCSKYMRYKSLSKMPSWLIFFCTLYQVPRLCQCGSPPAPPTSPSPSLQPPSLAAPLLHTPLSSPFFPWVHVHLPVMAGAGFRGKALCPAFLYAIVISYTAST